MTAHDPFRGDCPHCHRSATVVRPSPLWRLALVPAWLTCGAMVFLASFVGFGLVLLAPLVLAGGACLLSALHAKASAEPTCTACGKIAAWSAVQARPARIPVATRPYRATA